MTIDEAVKQLCEAPSCLSKSKAREILKEYRREVLRDVLKEIPLSMKRSRREIERIINLK